MGCSQYDPVRKHSFANVLLKKKIQRIWGLISSIFLIFSPERYLWVKKTHKLEDLEEHP